MAFVSVPKDLTKVKNKIIVKDIQIKINFGTLHNYRYYNPFNDPNS